jgi:2-polyprenyl-3-methyl-5-hydroxy-6-metoxy-1,4-benzoquinol methylase
MADLESANPGNQPVANADVCFTGGGYARTNYYRSHSWRTIYDELQSVSRNFVTNAWRDGTGGYEWPLDPLNSWSRVWEYPFVAYQLRNNGCENRGLTLLDVGGAVTFFSQYLTRKGFEVTILDSDPRMPEFYSEAFKRTSGQIAGSKRSKYLVCDARNTELPAASFDLITCVSVLEHIPNWELAAAEIIRLLKPNGLFIVTFDVEHTPPAHALTPDECAQLLQVLSESMELLTTMENSIPTAALTPFNNTWQPRETKIRPFYQRVGPITSLPRRIFNRLFKPSTNSREIFEDICVYGGVWRKK